MCWKDSIACMWRSGGGDTTSLRTITKSFLLFNISHFLKIIKKISLLVKISSIIIKNIYILK